MKKLYFLILSILISLSGFTQTREWNGGNGNWNDASKWTPVGVPLSTDIVLFSNGSATISNVPDISLKGIVVSQVSIVLNGAGQQPGVLTSGADNPSTAIEIHPGAALTIGNNLDLQLAENSQAAIDGVLIVNTGSRYYSDKGTTTLTSVQGVIRNNGEIISEAAKLAFLAGSRYEHSRNKGEIPLATWHQTSTCAITGVIDAAPTGTNQVFGNYTWDCENQSGGSLLGPAIPSTINGDLVIKKVGRGNDQNVFLRLPAQIKINGSFILSGGLCISPGSMVKLDLGGDLVIQAGTLRSSSTGTININFAGLQKQTYIKTGGVTDGINFNIRDNAILDLGEAELVGEGDFTVEAGGRLMTAHPEGIAASGNTGAVQLKGKRVFSPAADYVYNGSGPQITGSGLPPVVRRLIIDNKSNTIQGTGVKLSEKTNVTGELELLNGFLQTTSEQMLTIGKDGKVSGTDDSFVAGPMQKIGSTSFVFPTGWAGAGGGRIPIGIELAGDGTIQAEYKRAPATDKGTTINAPLHHINYCEYWELFPVVGSPKAKITMFYNAHSSCSPVSLINDFSTARVARSNGSSWSQMGIVNDSMPVGNGYVVSGSEDVVLNKSERFYALGNITNATDPLPVMFDNVQAYEKNAGVNIEWSNLTERDIAIYYVERSGNGMDYTIIGQYLPESNRDDKAHYVSFDAKPISGTNFYRIKVIEKSTKIIFSKVMRVETAIHGASIHLYPNPVTSKQLTMVLTGMKEGNYQVRIFNAMAQPVWQTSLTNKSNFMTQALVLPVSTPPGVYSMVITGNNYQETKMFIVQ